MRKVKMCFACYKPTDRGDGGKSRRTITITVANFEYIDEVEAAAEEEARKASTENKTTTNNPDRASYWEELLKDRYEVHKVEEFNAMGKGNRSRKQMVSVEDEDLAGLEDVSSEGEDDNYEAELTDEETAASGILTGRRPYRKKIRVDSAESLPLMEGEGRSFRVKGFNQNQRAAFVQIMIRFGVGEFDWAEFTPRLKQKTCKEIKEYGTLFLTHIAEDITDSPTFSDGVPKEGLRIEDVLVRIAVLLLIRDKVKAASEKPGTPLFPDDIVSRFPGLKSGRFWKEHHDLLLLHSVLNRDGQAKLKANVFFASFNERNDKAARESACATLAAVIASWLQSNQDNTPTRAQFNRLIVEGSSEWSKLRDNQDLINQFPNKHFDIETRLSSQTPPNIGLA
ncbi:hypothetical protein ACSBR1_037354 [Camellia fascicularis]